MENPNPESLKLAQLAAIVDSSDDAIIGKDLHSTITSWNAAAERIFGYTAEEMIGTTIKRLLPPDRLAEEDHILERLRAGERVDHFQTVRVTKDGRRIPVSLTISPIRNEQGVVVGASKIARDITAQVEFESIREKLLQQERKQRMEAEQANRIKNEFLATLSHELRTPLMAISGWAQILAGDVDAEMVRKAAEVITRNTNLQTQLIDELLDMNRILMGKMRLDIQSVDLGAIIDAAVDSIEPAAAAKHISVRKLLDPRAGAVRGDPTRLQQVFWNLLSNAVKFTPNGGRIEICLERVNSHVEIAVRDTGIGIPEEFLGSVFDRFSQADSSTTRRHGGLGLGLAIVKNLVELHGGAVGVKSLGEGHGSTFRVTLPFPAALDRSFAETHPRTMGGDPFEWNAPSLAGRRILVVDDDRDGADVVAHILKERGADVVKCASAEQALAQLNDGKFDVVVSDIGMPVMDGFEFIRAVRDLPPPATNIPAIALTAFGRAEDRRNAMVCGFDVFLSKPVDSAELVATVARAVGRVG